MRLAVVFYQQKQILTPTFLSTFGSPIIQKSLVKNFLAIQTSIFIETSN